MSVTLHATLSDLGPTLALILFGFLPNEVWRLVGLMLVHGLDEKSQVIVWVRAVATAMLALMAAGPIGPAGRFSPLDVRPVHEDHFLRSHARELLELHHGRYGRREQRSPGISHNSADVLFGVLPPMPW